MSSYNAVPEAVPAEQTPSLIFSDSAALKVNELIEEEGDRDLNLRVSIAGGGCSGFQYGFTFDKTIHFDDTVVEKSVIAAQRKQDGEPDDGDDDGGGSDGTVKLLIDALSIQYLMGAEIDYREDLQGARFIIRNPNAKTTCGCGSSFSI